MVIALRYTARLVATTPSSSKDVFCTRTLRLPSGVTKECKEPLRPDGSLNPIPLGAKVAVYPDQFQGIDYVRLCA